MDRKAEPQIRRRGDRRGPDRVRHARRAAQGEVRPDPHEAPRQGQAPVAAHEAEGRVRRGRERGSPEARCEGPRPPRKPPRPARAGMARPRRRSSSRIPTASSIPRPGSPRRTSSPTTRRSPTGSCRSSRTGRSRSNGCPRASPRRPRISGRRTRRTITPTGFRASSWRPSGARPVHYALVNDTATLLYLVNQGTLTFHVWASRTKDLDRPDFVLFDLDPGKASFADVIAVAKAIKATLDEEGVESFVKTSGKTGLHVLTPWTRDGGLRRGDGPGHWSSPSARPRRCPSRPPSTSARRSGASGSTSTSCRTPADTTPSRPTSCGPCPARPSRRRWTGRKSPRGSTPGRSR